MSSSQIEELRAEYFSIDTDRNGVISLGELRNALIQKHVKQDKIDSIFRTISEAGLDSPDLNYSDFLASAMLKRVSIDEYRLHHVFESLDPDGTGLVDVAALRDSLGADDSKDLVDDMLKEIDTNYDGKIDYREFLRYWKSLERAEKLSPLQKFAMTVKKTMSIITSFKRA